MGWRKAIRVGAVITLVAAIAAILLAFLNYVAAHRTESNFAEHAVEVPAVVVERPFSADASNSQIWVRLPDERTWAVPARASDFAPGLRVVVLVDRHDPNRMGIRGHEDSFRSLAARRLQLGFGVVFLLGCWAASILLVDMGALGISAGCRRWRHRNGFGAPDVGGRPR